MGLSVKGELTEAVPQKQLERLKNKILLTSYRLNLTHSHNPTASKKKFSSYMPCDNSNDNVIIVHVSHAYEA